MTQTTQTASSRHYMKTKTLNDLAQEICPCCARHDKLYQPRGIAGEAFFHDYHHEDNTRCFAAGLYLWAAQVGILFSHYPNPPSGKK